MAMRVRCGMCIYDGCDRTFAPTCSTDNKKPSAAWLEGFFIGERRCVSTALLHFRVVLVTVDAARLLVLLLVNRLAILMGQVPVILRAHASLFFVDARFLVFQPAGFARCQLAALYAVGDPALLVRPCAVGCCGRAARE